MDKSRIGLIGALVIGAIALVGGIVLAARGLPVPHWLASLLVLLAPINGAFALYAPVPSASPKPPGDKPADAPKDGVS